MSRIAFRVWNAGDSEMHGWDVVGGFMNRRVAESEIDVIRSWKVEDIEIRDGGIVGGIRN